MNILISGIHGFVGNNLITTVKDKYNIYGLDIITPHIEGVFTTYTWDQLSEIQNIDIIIHLAAITHCIKNLIDANLFFDINTIIFSY